MSYSFQEMCDRLSSEIKNLPFHWTSVWVESDGINSDCISTTGNLWATKVLTFNDNNIYTESRQVSNLQAREMVVNVEVKLSVFKGPLLIVSTRFQG